MTDPINTSRPKPAHRRRRFEDSPWQWLIGIIEIIFLSI